MDYQELIKKIGEFNITIPESLLIEGNHTKLRKVLEEKVDNWLSSNGVKSDQLKAVLMQKCWLIIENNTNLIFGQIEQQNGLQLVSDLKSPIVAGTQVKYKIISNQKYDRYAWSIIEKNTNKIIYKNESKKPEIRVVMEYSGEYVIRAECLSTKVDNTRLIELHQIFADEDPFLSKALKYENTLEREKKEEYIAAFRELINDFRGFVIAAAKSTGALGITPRFLASILFWEIRNNPKSKRDLEIEYALTALKLGNWLSPKYQNISMGVAQVRLSTAAMTNKEIEMIDFDKEKIAVQKEQINKEFSRLEPAIRENLVAQLEWPKSNVKHAAELLANLKNRPHRFPHLNRVAFANQEGPVCIIATEYNKGPTNTPVKDAGISDYGAAVWKMMHNPIVTNYFEND